MKNRGDQTHRLLDDSVGEF